MKPVRSVKNQYLGINAHLHSALQTQGGWAAFHSSHIDDIMRLLRARLLPMGYTAKLEKSLQIRRMDESDDPEAEETFYDSDSLHLSQPSETFSVGKDGEMVIGLAEMLRITQPEIKYSWAVGVYQTAIEEFADRIPVAWIELLSPSNKPGGQDVGYYLTKRFELLHEGCVFVEIDYLHESAPTFGGFASYPIPGKGAKLLLKPEACAYRILVADPRPNIIEGEGHIYNFKVDEPIPVVNIPLNASDLLEFDFGAPYAKTFEETFYGVEVVDYSQLPQNFDRYSEDDQARIVARMLAVIEAAQSGQNLEDGPFPVKPVTLENGLAQLERLANG
jgi:uncharacterized protein DUF4058